jgi:hypothetical protein
MTPEEATRSAAGLGLRKIVSRGWVWIGILTLLVWVYPVAYRTTRLLTVLGVALLWAGALFLWWRKRIVTVPLLAMTLLGLGLVSLPARPVQTEALARDYCGGLRFFRGVRYIWGGEGLLGIDCSGLVRQGLIWGQFRHGLRTVNGGPIRNALWLWWNDCSARDLRDGFGGLTRECSRAKSVVEADDGRLRPGDLAVTANGVHVMAYLGNQTWIEADPVIGKVQEITFPTDNPWFREPVVLVRWRWLDRTGGASL